LAIEIVLPSDTVSSLLGKKKERYRRCGTSEVWIISPGTREVLVYSASGDRILREGADLTSDLLPGFRLPVASLFAGHGQTDAD
jgi:Uma2 family endonuclease